MFTISYGVISWNHKVRLSYTDCNWCPIFELTQKYTLEIFHFSSQTSKLPNLAVLCCKKFGRLTFLSLITVLRSFFCILSRLHLSDAFVNKHTIEQLFSPRGITELKRHNKVFSGTSSTELL